MAAFSCVIISGIPPFLFLSSPFHMLSISLFHFLSITSRHTYDQMRANVYYLSYCVSLYLSIALFCPVYQIDVRDILRGIEVEIFSSSHPLYHLHFFLPFTLSISPLSYLSLPLYISPTFLSPSLSLYHSLWRI